MSDPRVVHCKRDPYDVYIGRGGHGAKWGNPFVIGQHGTRDEVIAKYEAWLPTQPALLALIKKQHGKDWSCWCAPLPCHCDINLEIAKEEEL